MPLMELLNVHTELQSVHQALLKGGGHFNLGRLRSGAQSKDKRTLNKLRCVTVVYSEC